ncbi:hypothetical protein LPW36_10710 [Jinshanibacter sp. LJY008]|uniref:Uncharacterized protein n=1 Tax=Limnobaculum eriocheiris TaxID=2897391 RepID=A0A9X1MVS6_9GAMM|nr:hypothetical protein [Limnobaculum eriocheiris]MCD1126461.1 hypothetical protein [Limnobaculum eriocheiris]
MAFGPDQKTSYMVTDGQEWDVNSRYEKLPLMSVRWRDNDVMTSIELKPLSDQRRKG